MNKNETVSYVLVPDTLENGQSLSYFTGLFRLVNVGENILLPMNTHEYDESLKLCFKDEAEQYCAKLNQSQQSFKFHVEEHMYM
jgi:hypothetical protein